MKHYFVLGLYTVLLSLAFIVFPHQGDTTDKIILVGTEDADNLTEGRWLIDVYTEVFRRIGYQFEFQSYPVVRASKMADSGKVDGEMYRADDYSEEFQNLIRVDKSDLVAINLVAYSAKPEILLNGWDSLRNTEYKVEYRRGVKKIENRLSQVIKSENLSAINRVDQGLKKLIMGRIDIFVDAEIAVMDSLRKLDPHKFDKYKVYRSGTMESIPLYMFLHKKHADLVPKVTEVLKTMQQEGLIAKLRNRAMAEQKTRP